MSNSAIHCSLADRAYTNLITNATRFSGINLREDIGRLLTVGGFPQESVPSVLHESVHHWCFLTPVGSTLALLRTRSHMRAIEWAITDDDTFALNAIDDHLRYEATILALRPLAEGLALFFEYDVMPYPSTPIASIPMQWAYVFFGHPTEEEIASAWGVSLLSLLGDVRTSELMIRRKTNLLLQPLRCSAGGYLPGYLAVKNLWRSCRSRHNPFYDADLFAQLLRRYFYGDYGLVDLILDKSVDGPTWIGSLVEYIGRRVEGLLRLDLEVAERSLIETGLNPSGKEFHDGWIRLSQNPPMDTEPAVAERGVQRVDELIGSLRTSLSNSVLSDVAGDLSNVQMLPLGYRHLLWLGQMEVGLQLSADNVVSVFIDNDKLFDADLMVDAGELPDTGMLDLYMSVFEYFIGATVSMGGTMVASFMSGSVDDATRDAFLNLNGDREVAEQLHASLIRAYDIVADVFRAREYHKTLLGHADDIIEGIYLPAALLYVPGESRTRVAEMMRKDGVLAVVDGDLSLLRSAAALSMGASLRLHPEEVAMTMPSFSAPVEEVLATLENHSTSKDVPMVFGKAGYELASYI